MVRDDEASARLEATVERFCQFICALAPGAPAAQAWGPKEVLAHLVYHHELYVRLVEAFVAGIALEPPRGRFRELNAAAVAASAGIRPDELVVRLRLASRRLLELYRQHEPGEITVEIKAGARRRSLATLVPEVEAHIRNHLEKLRREAL